MLELNAAIMPRRSAIAAGFAEKRPQRPAHHVADRRPFRRRPRPDGIDQARGELERHRRAGSATATGWSSIWASSI